MTRRAAVLSGIVFLLFGAPPSRAAAPSLASACQLDFQLFCAEIDPESERAPIVACLERHVASLTESCRAALDPASVPRAADPVDGACSEDFRKLCSGATDRVSAARCVQRHYEALSPACQDALAPRMKNRGGPPVSPIRSPAP